MANGTGTIVEHRLDAEGADALLLAGVNDANIQELVRIFGIRVVLRGDHVILSGDVESVERAIGVVRHMIELSRLRASFDTNDVARFAESLESVGAAGVVGGGEEIRIALPGSRKIIAAKSEGQRRYLEAISNHDIVI